MSNTKAKKTVSTPPRPPLLSTRRSKERLAAFTALAIAIATVAVLLDGLHSSYQAIVRIFSWTALAGAICFINVKLPSDRKRPALIKRSPRQRGARR